MSRGALAALLLLLAAACNDADPGVPDAVVADADPTAPDAGMLSEVHVTVGPGAVFELTAELAAGTRLTMTYQAGASLAWTLHAHDGGGTTVLKEGAGASGQTLFTADAAGTYFLQWMNGGDVTASLDAFVTLEGEGTVAH